MIWTEMIWTGKKVSNNREIIWAALSGSAEIGLMCWYYWMMFVGTIFSAWMIHMSLDSFQAETPAHRVRDLEMSTPFLAVGLLFIVGGVCGLLWQDYLAFDLCTRMYFRRRGIGRWAKDVVSGDFADFSHIEVDGNEYEEGTRYVVSLVWAETLGGRFKLSGASRAEQAAALAAELAVPLKIPVQQKWLREERAGTAGAKEFWNGGGRWECHHCDASSQADMDVCWRCGAGRDDLVPEGCGTLPRKTGRMPRKKPVGRTGGRGDRPGAAGDAGPREAGNSEGEKGRRREPAGETTSGKRHN